MTKDEKQFEVRDMRRKEKFFVDDLYLNGYAKKCGIYATGVYLSLCRHADKEQKCFPSKKKIAEELNISIRQVDRAILILEKENIVKKIRVGKKCNNRYLLLDKSEWTDSRITYDYQSYHPTTDSRIHSKDTQLKDTHSKELAEQAPQNKEIPLLIDKFKEINPSYKKFFANTTQRAAVQRLLDQHGFEVLSKILEILSKTNSMQYAPVITTPTQLEDKFASLVAFVSREKVAGNDRKLIKI